MTDRVDNVLASRYASRSLRRLWSEHGKILLERELWIAVLKAQRDLGLNIPAEAIEAYERTKEQVDLASIRRREAGTRHDVKAKIEEFCALAGHEQIHKGMTSRDLTDNVEQFQVLKKPSAHRAQVRPPSRLPEPAQPGVAGPPGRRPNPSRRRSADHHGKTAGHVRPGDGPRLPPARGTDRALSPARIAGGRRYGSRIS